MQRISVIDSHTGGEPTRLIISGGPDLGDGPLSERLARFERDFDHFRRATVNEPRGSDVIVGGLIVEPHAPGCVCGIIFFNNVGYLGMCGHGTIGLVATLAYQGKLGPGTHKIDTPVGVVSATLHPDGRVSIENVVSYRTEKAVGLTLPSGQRVTGDIAWGGNWFFLCADHGEEVHVGNVERLTALSWEIRRELNRSHPELDHIELFAPPGDPENHSRSFVLCPGGAYDRSPCGTGTSAKLACLAADGKLAPGEIWRQESVIGSVFEGSVVASPRLASPRSTARDPLRLREEGEYEGVIPTITGQAWISAEATLLLDDTDPFCWGI
jgi:4-hydroxyproline epimerase